jgi:hypothetical protein
MHYEKYLKSQFHNLIVCNIPVLERKPFAVTHMQVELSLYKNIFCALTMYFLQQHNARVTFIWGQIWPKHCLS